MTERTKYTKKEGHRNVWNNAMQNYVKTCSAIAVTRKRSLMLPFRASKLHSNFTLSSAVEEKPVVEEFVTVSEQQVESAGKKPKRNITDP